MNSDCRAFRSQIADVVTGLLSASEVQGLQEHLNSCEDCRGYMQVLQEEESRLTDYFARLDSQNAQRQQRVLQALATPQVNRRTTIVSIWRIIMANRYSRLGAVAAVFAIVAVSLVILDKSTTAAYAIGDVSAAFDQARIIHINGQQYFPGHTLDNGDPIPPMPIDTWIDLENGRTRQVSTGMSQRTQMISRTGVTTHTTVSMTETISDGAYMMTLDHAAKTAAFAKISDYQRRLMAYQQSRLLWGQLSGPAAQLEDFVKAGQEDINGKAHDIWQLESAHSFGSTSGTGGAGGVGIVRSSSGGTSTPSMGTPTIKTRYKLWLAADTGRLARAQTWMQMGNGRWLLHYDYQTIEYDVELPAGIFTLEPPAGYTAANSKETASQFTLRGPSARCAVDGRNLECSIPASFTLADGSVVVGWQSLDTQAHDSQAAIFEGLTLGGPLPKLPIEIHGLQPAGTSTGPAYTGYHLACTRKADRFTEWTLYVPAGTPLTSVQRGYTALYRFNLNPTPSAAIGLTVPSGVPVKTTEDFDAWILGGMAEFSDDGKAPTDLTYQKVVDLAQQLRISAIP